MDINILQIFFAFLAVFAVKKRFYRLLILGFIDMVKSNHD